MSDDTFTLPEATQLKADAFMLRQKLERAEQARKDLVHINQGLHRQVAELQKNNDELQKGMMVSSHSNGSPQSVENGFCMVEPMSRSSQSQASVGEVDEALVTMQLQSKQEEVSGDSWCCCCLKFWRLDRMADIANPIEWDMDSTLI